MSRAEHQTNCGSKLITFLPSSRSPLLKGPKGDTVETLRMPNEGGMGWWGEGVAEGLRVGGGEAMCYKFAGGGLTWQGQVSKSQG